MSSKYIFKKLKDPENHYDNAEVTFEIESCYKPELLEYFRDFLRACGFSVGDLEEAEEQGEET